MINLLFYFILFQFNISKNYNNKFILYKKITKFSYNNNKKLIYLFKIIKVQY